MKIVSCATLPSDVPRRALREIDIVEGCRTACLKSAREGSHFCLLALVDLPEAVRDG